MCHNVCSPVFSDVLFFSLLCYLHGLRSWCRGLLPILLSTSGSYANICLRCWFGWFSSFSNFVLALAVKLSRSGVRPRPLEMVFFLINYSALTASLTYSSSTLSCCMARSPNLSALGLLWDLVGCVFHVVRISTEEKFIRKNLTHLGKKDKCQACVFRNNSSNSVIKTLLNILFDPWYYYRFWRRKPCWSLSKIE